MAWLTNRARRGLSLRSRMRSDGRTEGSRRCSVAFAGFGRWSSAGAGRTGSSVRERRNRAAGRCGWTRLRPRQFVTPAPTPGWQRCRATPRRPPHRAPATSAAASSTCPAALAADHSGQRLGRLEHRRPGVLRLEHRGVARLFEDRPGEPVVARGLDLDDHRAVLQLLDDALVLAGPARALRREPDTAGLGLRDLVGTGPLRHVGSQVGARLEALAGDARLANAVQAEGAGVALCRIPRVDVPALVSVVQEVGLDTAA